MSRKPGTGEQGHSYRRYRGILLGGGFGGLSKAISLLTVAISVPLTVRYLGGERYGMWMTISSFITMLSFADLGMGSGLVSALAAAEGKGEAESSVRLVSSAFFFLAGLAVFLLISFGASYRLVQWAHVLKVRTPLAIAEAGPSILAFIGCFAIGLPFSLVQRVQAGLQETWRANIWQSLASIAALVGVLCAIAVRAGVMWLVLAMNGATVLVSIINWTKEFYWRRPSLRPRLQSFEGTILRALLKTSAAFVVLQLSVMMGTASDSIIIARLYGATAVAPYAVVYKLFQASLVFSLFMYPLWPALGEALARGDYQWAKSALARAVKFSAIGGAMLALVLVTLGGTIIRLWVGGRVVPSQSLIDAFAAWALLSAYGGAITSLLNNPPFLKWQTTVYGVASVVALALKIPLAERFGPAGVVWATVIAYAFVYCMPAELTARRFFAKHARAQASP